MSTRRSFILFGAAAAVGLGAAGVLRARETARRVPPPILEESLGAKTSETLVLAGGCFWGVQGVFQHVRGVTSAVSGYAGGDGATARYEMVETGETGHAESVRIAYDPRQVRFGDLLQIYFSVAHDPTQLNRQGPDYGPQYRSAIFPNSREQEQLARGYVGLLTERRVFPDPIVTRIEPGKPFFPAERHHQDYLALHPDDPYIARNDMPKLASLRRLFPEHYQAKPVLVGDMRL